MKENKNEENTDTELYLVNNSKSDNQKRVRAGLGELFDNYFKYAEKQSEKEATELSEVTPESPPKLEEFPSKSPKLEQNYYPTTQNQMTL